MKRKSTSRQFFVNLFAIAATALFVSPTASAQVTVIYNENFDADSTALPLGWSAHGNAWHVETSNNSTGYLGASGHVNACIRNDSANGTYDLISKSISTLGYSSINVIWGARLTTNFPTTGSAVQGLYWSTDNGVTWNTLNYTENTNNSIWALDNAGTPIALPAGASNQASVMFKWTVSIVNGANGTYRIDDFTVGGLVTGINESPSIISSVQVFPNPSNGETHLQLHAKSNTIASVEIFDVLGQQTGIIPTMAITQGNSSVALDGNFFPVNGIYFIRVKTGNEIQTLRFVKN